MTANEVDQALVAERDEVGDLLLSISEDQWFDRKSSRIAVRDLGQHLCAFANAEGGVIVVGLSKGKVEGLKDSGKRLNDLQQASLDFTVPPVRARVDLVECITSSGEPDHLAVFRIDPSERVHETQNGDCYLRVGDESRRLSFTQRQELNFDKGEAQYDGYAAPGVAIIDLDGELLKNYRDKTGATETRSLFHARSLLTRDEEVTNACYLLFGPHPQDLFPQAYVRILRFLDVERGTGGRLAVEEGSDIRIEGPIPRAIMEAAGEIERLIPKRRSLSPSGTFDPKPIVPRDAWLEGLVNAVIHRSYSLAGDHIRVEIYPNRVEIESPGRFPGLANPSAPLDISRFARNPRIARVCADLRIGQELGEGIKRMFEEMRLFGLTDPVYKQGQGSVRLSLQAIPRLDSRAVARLPRGSQEVLQLLRTAERGLSTGDVAEAMAMSRPSANKRLKALEGEGLVTWHGKSPRDPRAIWTLSEN